MQSVEAEDLFESIIHPLLPSRRLGFFFTPAVSYSIPASLVFSKSSRQGAIFPLSGLLIHTCYMSRLHSEFGS